MTSDFRRTLRARYSRAAVLLALVLTSVSHAAMAEKKPFRIDAQDATITLTEFARQGGIQILFAYERVKGVTTNAIDGDYEPVDAIRLLVKGTGLEASEQSAGIFFVEPRKAGAGVMLEPERDAAPKRSFWERFRVAQADQGKTAGGEFAEGGPAEKSDTGPEGKSSPTLEEIIVTAQKREERLQEVPVPVTALSAASLAESNQTRLQDYYTRIPGLSFTPGTNGRPQLAIRGITTDAAINPTVGMTVDDVPYGASTGLGGGTIALDIDPSDLTRVEVLRGPQGTLYGASNLGGLLKFVTIDPSTDRVSGRVQGSVSGVHNGDEAGYSARAAINLPLGETSAVRASGFTRHDPGYIDNSVSGIDGINLGKVDGGRLSGLWRPSNDFSLKLSAMLNDSKTEGSPTTNIAPGLADLETNSLPGTGGFQRKTQVYSANVSANLGATNLVSVSAYTIDDILSINDVPSQAANAQSNFGVRGALQTDSRQTRKATQEIRLSVPIGGRIDWLLGGFYGHEKSPVRQIIYAASPVTGATVGTLLDVSAATRYEEYAGFTNVSLELTERFDVQVGGRYSAIEQSFAQMNTGPLGGGLVVPQRQTQASAFTYLMTPRFKVSPDLMLYARLASGYRAGGPNANTQAAEATGTPLEYSPDKTRNYEIGVKGDALDDALSFDASLYYIDWQDIQLRAVFERLFSYLLNGGRARSQGVELSVESRPVTGLSISAWVAYNDAELTESLPPTSTLKAISGDRLPNSARWSGRFSVDQDFPLGATATGFVGGSVNYVGDRLSLFTTNAAIQRFVAPSCTQIDLRTGVRYDSWTLNLFANNVADRRGVLAGTLASTSTPGTITYIQPRTIGLSLDKTF